MNSSGFKELQEAISTTLVATTRTTGLIANEDLAFHRASDASIDSLLKQQEHRLLAIAQQLTKAAVAGTNVAAPQLSDTDSIENNWKGFVDVIDNVLERADSSLDEYTGLIRRPSTSEEKQAEHATAAPSKVRAPKIYNATKIEKPQLHFARPPSNFESKPFKPLLIDKPHAIVPLDQALQPLLAEDGYEYHKNPYEIEIHESPIPPAVRTRSDPISYLSFDSTSATFVDTLEAVHAMLDELKKASEIAVDLEHHDEHSFIGIVSLMQISTREKDWVIDTLKPWRHELEVLNEVFANPSITKVLHGSTMDIIWLQRDLGLYVVSLFDTYHATWALGYPKHSLAFLLKKFINFDAAKQYQMADWRTRPLPQEMFDYARSDTHFLLFVYDLMRNELIEKSDASNADGDLIGYVMSRSREEAVQHYERPRYDEVRGSGPMGWFNLLYRTPTLLDREQFAVFRAVHRWRDQVARQEDENVNFILQRKSLFNVARGMPMDMPSLLRSVHPITLPLQNRKVELLELVKQARANASNQPEMHEFFPSNSVQSTTSSNVDTQRGLRASDSGVGGALKSLDFNRCLLLKADTSLLWGSALKFERRNIDDRMKKHSFQTPLPQLKGDVLSTPKTISQSSEPSQNESGELPPLADQQPVNGKLSKEIDDVFVVREASDVKKRKRSSPSGTSAKRILPVGDDVFARTAELNQNHESPDLEKALRKQKRREQRLEAKQTKQSLSGNADGSHQTAADVTPEFFDYSKAPSILNATKRPEVPGTSTKRSVNPYAKSLDTRTGLPSTQKETVGKTMTFTK